MSDDRPPLFSPTDRDLREAVRDSLTKTASSYEMEGWQPSLQERIRSLGFVDEAARAFDLLPLVLVAWADGSIQGAERAKILEIVRMRGLAGTPAFTMFEALLEVRPAQVYLLAALDLLRELVADRADRGASVVQLCVQVAAAASDALGSPDPISGQERDAIARIANILGASAHADVARRLAE